MDYFRNISGLAFSNNFFSLEVLYKHVSFIHSNIFSILFLAVICMIGLILGIILLGETDALEVFQF